MGVGSHVGEALPYATMLMWTCAMTGAPHCELSLGKPTVAPEEFLNNRGTNWLNGAW